MSLSALPFNHLSFPVLRFLTQKRADALAAPAAIALAYILF
jgi:hypothetical protein